VVREEHDGHGRELNMDTDTSEVVRELIAWHTEQPVSALTDDAGMTTGTWNSLKHLTVLTAVAQRFGFSLDPRLVRDLTTVGALVRYARDHRTSRRRR